MVQKSINLAASLGSLFNDNTDEIIKKCLRGGEQPQQQTEFFNITISFGGAARWKQEGCCTCTRRQMSSAGASQKFCCIALGVDVGGFWLHLCSGANADVEGLKGARVLKYYFKAPGIKGAVSKVSATSIRVTLEVYGI